jgi:hypothetical protein
MSKHPATPRESAPREIVTYDIGGWISGGCADVEPVTAENVRTGDIVIISDAFCEVTDRRDGFWHFEDGSGFGIALGWKSIQGTASGVAFRHEGDELQRVATT